MPIRALDQDEFTQLDYRVMQCAFESQNELGRLCDEVVYQNDLAARLRTAGLGPVRKEVPVTVTHQDFAKTYSLDLVVGDGAIYELKAENGLVAEHEAQLLNYLFLREAPRGKLINFRPAKVESRFVNAPVTPQARRRWEVDAQRWRETGAASTLIHARMLDLLDDWGGFLELPLYIAALAHFLGGEEKVMQTVALARGAVPLGNQRVHLASPGIAFRLTALSDGAKGYEPHLCSLLAHSPLEAIQWINLAHHRIEFVTLRK